MKEKWIQDGMRWERYVPDKTWQVKMKMHPEIVESDAPAPVQGYINKPTWHL